MTQLEKFKSLLATYLPNNTANIGGIVVLFAYLQAHKNLQHDFLPLEDATTGPILKDLLKHFATASLDLTEEKLHEFFTDPSRYAEYDPFSFEKMLKEKGLIPHAGTKAAEQFKDATRVTHLALIEVLENSLRLEHQASKASTPEPEHASAEASTSKHAHFEEGHVHQHKEKLKAEQEKGELLIEELKVTLQEAKQINTQLQEQLKARAQELAQEKAKKETLRSQLENALQVAQHDSATFAELQAQFTTLTTELAQAREANLALQTAAAPIEVALPSPAPSPVPKLVSALPEQVASVPVATSPLEPITQLAYTLPTVTPKSVPSQSAFWRTMGAAQRTAHTLHEAAEGFFTSLNGSPLDPDSLSSSDSLEADSSTSSLTTMPGAPGAMPQSSSNNSSSESLGK
jgi:hypothetical protein